MKFLTWNEKLGREECPYLRRWIINLKFISFRIHQWYYSDDARHKHDHSWWFFTFVLKGGYTDITPHGSERMNRFSWAFRPASHIHTVSVDSGGCWTFLITGPIVRRWGFWVKGKFNKSNKYFLEWGHHHCNET